MPLHNRTLTTSDRQNKAKGSIKFSLEPLLRLELDSPECPFSITYISCNYCHKSIKLSSASNRESKLPTTGKIAVPGKEGGDKGDDDAVCIYLHVVVGRRLSEWFVIKTGSVRSKEPADPVFDSEPNCRLFSCYTVVGSTIYIIGGREEVLSSNYPAWSDESYPAVADVYYIDILSPGVGWKKLAHPKNVARQDPYAFPINSKIYVMGGNLDWNILSPIPEVYDTEEEQAGLRILEDPETPVLVDGHKVCVDDHAVVDGGKRVIVVSGRSPHLYRYDVEGEHSWEIDAEDILGLRKQISAVIGGILYYPDPFEEGDMFGVEIANPKEPKIVVWKLGIK